MYTKKCIPQSWRFGALALGFGVGFGASFARAAPPPGAPSSTPAANVYSAYSPSIGVDQRFASTYQSSSEIPQQPTRYELPPRPTPIVYPAPAPQSFLSKYDRSGDPEEAAMLAACGMERRPFGSAFDGSRVASNWKWSEVRNDPRREIEFSQRRHGGVEYQNPMCEMFILRRMYEQGGSASVSYRCELRRDSYARSLGNFQAGRGDGSAGFAMLDKVMKSRSAANNQSICRSPGSEDLFACATQDLTNNALDGALQREMATGVMDVCVSSGANMTPSQSYYNAGIIQNGNGYCGQSGGITVLTQNEPWYKTVLSAGLGALKVLGPLYVMDRAHERREATSQLAVKSNAKLGFPSAVTGSGGCYGYGACGSGGGGFAGGAIGIGLGTGFGGQTSCGTPPYQGCGGGGYYPGNQFGQYGNQYNGYAGVAGYNGLNGYYPQQQVGGYYNGGNGQIGNGQFNQFGGPQFGQIGNGQYGNGQYGSQLPGPWGTMGNAASNGYAPVNNQWGVQGQFGQAPFWGTGAGNAYAGANNGYFQDSAQAQFARSIENNNRYSQLYGNLGIDSRANSNNMRDTASSYYSNEYSQGGGYQYYPAYIPQPQAFPQPIPQAQPQQIK